MEAGVFPLSSAKVQVSCVPTETSTVDASASVRGFHRGGKVRTRSTSNTNGRAAASLVPDSFGRSYTSSMNCTG